MEPFAGLCISAFQATRELSIVGDNTCAILESSKQAVLHVRGEHRALTMMLLLAYAEFTAILA